MFEQALERLRAGDRAGVLEAMRAAWRETRDPIAAAIVEALTAELHPGVIRGKTVTEKHHHWLGVEGERTPADTAMLIRGLAIGRLELAEQRMERVRDWEDPDPVVASGLLALLEKPPYPSQSALGLWELALAILVKLADPRSVERLRKIAKGAWPGSSRMSALMKARMREAADAIAALERRPLAPGEVAARDAIAGLVLPAEPSAAGVRTEAELLAEIYERPDDDELRKVYGDMLMLREDPRGTLIALQCRPEPDEASAKVAANLLRKHRKLWLGPLADIAEDVVFERGFVASLAYRGRYASQLKAVTGAREWATVRALRLVETRTQRGLVELLTHPVMRSLREVRGLGSGDLAVLADEGCSFEVIGYRDGQVRFELSRFPRLRELEVSAYYIDSLDWLRTSQELGTLERLDITMVPGTFTSWLIAGQDRGARLRSITLRPYGVTGHVCYRVERGEGGKLDAVSMRPAEDAGAFPELQHDELVAALRELPRGRVGSLVVEGPPSTVAAVRDARHRLAIQ